MNRRHLLSRLTRAAATLAWQQVFMPAGRAQAQDLPAWRHPGEVFTLGVASGEPRHDAVVLWTRLAPQPLAPDGGMPARAVPVRWELAGDEHFRQPVRSGEAVAEPASVHSVHVEVDGLLPSQVYFYRFEAGGQRSPVGRTRTAPHPHEANGRVRVALASCQHYEAGHFAAHREIAASDVDVVAFLGDYIYENDLPGYRRRRRHPHSFGHDGPYDLPGYRQHHAGYKLDPDLRACHAAHPWLMVWDDHDVMNDYTGLVAPDHEDPAAFLQIRTAAYRAYFEHMPLSPARAPVGAHMRMQGRYAWGRLAEFWTLDGRQYRDPHACEGGIHVRRDGHMLWHCDAVEAPRRTFFGFEQEKWLAQGLASSGSTWKFVVQSTQLAPGPVRTPLGSLIYADGWDAYPRARERLMSAIAQPGVADVIVLGGDVHRHVAANLRRDPANLASPIVASEFVVGSVTSPGLSELMTAWMQASNPDLLHLRSDQRGYAVLDISPDRVACEFRGIAHPVEADARSSMQARYVVQRGVPGPRGA